MDENPYQSPIGDGNERDANRLIAFLWRCHYVLRQVTALVLMLAGTLFAIANLVGIVILLQESSGKDRALALPAGVFLAVGVVVIVIGDRLRRD